MPAVPMTLGIMTPILSWRQGAPEWIQRGTIADVAYVVGEAERLGYHFCTCSEHVGIPPAEVGRRGAAYWDPLASFSYLAATTSSIRLVAWLVVLGYHHPLELAKRYGQLDLMSDGRFVLGVGVGSLQEEFELLGAPFDDRGERADDALRALRATWGRSPASYSGTHFEFTDWRIEPHAPRTEVPLWVGGRTRRSLRRAIELGDGWAPFALELDRIAEMLDWAQSLAAWPQRPGRLFEVMVESPELDPSGEPDRTREWFADAEATGVTLWGARVVAHSRGHYVEQLTALRELFPGH